MKSIHLIHASAGTGKTTRLTEELRDAIVSSGVRPDAIVAVTFTRKAASELVERARRVLLAAGEPEAANRLLAARIGTVHSVCGRLVAEWSLMLGLSPDLTVLGEVDAAKALREAISTVLDDGERSELEQLSRRMPGMKWDEAILHVVQTARINRIEPEAFGRDATRSLEMLIPFLGDPVPTDAGLDEQLLSALRAFLDQPRVTKDGVQKTQKAVATARRVQTSLERGESPSWPDWVALARLDVSKKLDALAAPVREAAGLHDRHPRLHRDLERAIHLVFEVSRRASYSYERWKRLRRAVDFVDQEVLALTLLDDPGVERALSQEIDLFLVDELQDTSPIQLELFLRLAGIAGRAIWVGDPKQAIYGFRGADADLMDATADGLTEPGDLQLLESALRGLRATTETLDRSYRSRPGLVDLTSGLFGRIFAAHGMKEETVHLVAEPRTEPEGLGPIVEYWPLEDAGTKIKAAASLARTLSDLLSDSDVWVRDRRGGARPAHAGDVALLCMTNAQCEAVARALAARGIPIVLARTSLLETMEAHLATCALRLLLDPRDRLASATIERIIAEDPNAWLRRTEEEQTQEEDGSVHPVVARLKDLARTHRNLDALAAFDAALSELGALDHVARFEKAEERRANLDALRALAARWIESTRSMGRCVTLAGLLAYFVALRRPPPGALRSDDRAVPLDPNAVTIATWHRAKGLEWPIVVLFGLDHNHEPRLFGVEAISDRSSPDLGAPLADRWLRFWPTPYYGLQKATKLRERLTNSEIWSAAVERTDRELLRLLYVGWTRARDKLVLASPTGKMLSGILGRVRDIDAQLLSEPESSPVTWAGRAIELKIRVPREERSVERSESLVRVYERAQAASHPPAFVAPSSTKRHGETGAVYSIHSRLRIGRGADLELVGSAMHAWLAADDVSMPSPERLGRSARLLARWRVHSFLHPDDLLSANDALHAWIRARWPDARAHRELPLQSRRKDGSIIRGTADLVLEADEGFVILDHKCFPGGREASLEVASSFAGQLALYREALEEASGRPVVGTFIHLPISGMVVEVKCDDPDRSPASTSAVSVRSSPGAKGAIR